MLHDPSHVTPPEVAEEIHLEQFEIDVLKKLAEEWAKIATQSVHKEKAVLWQKMNDLESERPMVWINEIPWHEMNYKDELTILSWAAIPVMPVFNFTDSQNANIDEWQTMLARRNLHISTRFDSVAFEFEDEMHLWQNGENHAGVGLSEFFKSAR